jgi:hypothetical protein
MLYHDMDWVTAFLDQYPNADVEISCVGAGSGLYRPDKNAAEFGDATQPTAS